MGAPAILYDATHLIARRRRTAPRGIPRVDLAYASGLAGRPGILAAGIRYGLFRPSLLAPSRVAEIAAELSCAWEGDGDPSRDPRYRHVRAFLVGGAAGAPPSRPIRLQKEAGFAFERLKILGAQGGRFDLPRDAVYLNVAQHLLEHPRFFRWLETRPGIRPVFMLHDLLPLDFPRLFGRRIHGRFLVRLETMRRHARGIIVTCEATKRRVAEHFARQGRGDLPIHVQHLPPEARFSQPVMRDAELADAPYVMMVGTIEPRKNHLFVLDLWRRFARAGRKAPKLLIVGAVGWQCRSVLAALRDTEELRGAVLHVTGLSDAAYRHFLAHARALLQPSIMEGYGLPLVEAATAGIPVIASDLDVFREVCQGHGAFLALNDRESWQDSILELVDSEAAGRRQAAMADFRAPEWSTYMDGVLDFVAAL